MRVPIPVGFTPEMGLDRRKAEKMTAKRERERRKRRRESATSSATSERLVDVAAFGEEYLQKNIFSKI